MQHCEDSFQFRLLSELFNLVEGQLSSQFLNQYMLALKITLLSYCFAAIALEDLSIYGMKYSLSTMAVAAV